MGNRTKYVPGVGGAEEREGVADTSQAGTGSLARALSNVDFILERGFSALARLTSRARWVCVEGRVGWRDVLYTLWGAQQRL